MGIGQEMKHFCQERCNGTADDDAKEYTRESDANLHDRKNVLWCFKNPQSSNSSCIAVICKFFQTTFVTFGERGFHQRKKTACRYEEHDQDYE